MQCMEGQGRIWTNPHPTHMGCRVFQREKLNPSKIPTRQSQTCLPLERLLSKKTCMPGCPVLRVVVVFEAKSVVWRVTSCKLISYFKLEGCRAQDEVCAQQAVVWVICVNQVHVCQKKRHFTMCSPGTDASLWMNWACVSVRSKFHHVLTRQWRKQLDGLRACVPDENSIKY